MRLFVLPAGNPGRMSPPAPAPSVFILSSRKDDRKAAVVAVRGEDTRGESAILTGWLQFGVRIHGVRIHGVWYPHGVRIHGVVAVRGESAILGARIHNDQRRRK